MSAPAPFLDWLADRVGTRQWVVAPRLTARLRDKGYALALPQARYTTLQTEWQVLADLDRAERIALRLFPDDFHDGHDCMAEVDRVGLPCRVCADNRARWLDRINAVAAALKAET